MTTVSQLPTLMNLELQSGDEFAFDVNFSVSLAGYTVTSQIVSAAHGSPVPASITARQARLWLIRNGITLTQVDAVIDSIPDPLLRESVRVEWEYGTEVHRESPFIAQLGPALGLDAARLDQAFREAAAI